MLRMSFAFVAALALGLGLVAQAKLSAEKPDTSLSVTAPVSVSVKQGQTQTFSVSIKREGFTDPVKLIFDVSDVKGVSIVEKETVVPKDKTSATFTLKATDDATVTAKGVGTVAAEGGGRKTEGARFTIKVIEK